MSFFTFSHFLLYWKVYFSPWAMGSVKSSSTDYNELKKPNPNSLRYIGSKKSLIEIAVPKNELFQFFLHFSLYWKVYFFTLSHGFLKRVTNIKFLQNRKHFFLYFLKISQNCRVYHFFFYFFFNYLKIISACIYSKFH